MANERKFYGDGYYIVWAFFSSLYVQEKVEHFSFSFDNLLVAIGGNLGLFLGWSLQSIVLDAIDFLYQRFKKSPSPKSSIESSKAFEETYRAT